MKNDVRVKNNFGAPLHVIVGPVDFGTIGSVKTTEYKRIPEGSHDITGDVSGKVAFNGRGKYKWTIYINSGGAISIKEDPK